jgi:magnesium-transporting ATPase (P-type)
MNTGSKTGVMRWLVAIVAAVLASLGIGFWLAWRKRNKTARLQRQPAFAERLLSLGETGLSEAEAARRQSDQRQQESQRVARLQTKSILLASTFSVFNLTMLVLAISQVWLDDPWGALGTIGVLVLNLAISFIQQVFASRMVSQAAQQAKPYATVIRSGHLRSVDLDEVVMGDVLVAGQGDEILADGILLTAENLVLVDPVDPNYELLIDSQGRPDHPAQQPGQDLKAGWVCKQGEAVYQAASLPPVLTFEKSEVPSQNDSNGALKPRKTPLEKILLQVLYFLLIMCGLFYLLLVLQILSVEVLTDEQMLLYRDVMSIVFSLAPTGLFLVVVVNYAMGTIDLARQGALVRDKRSVEMIAQLDSLLFIRSTSLSEITIELEFIPTREGKPVLADNYTRRILGNLARSVTARNDTLRSIITNFDGERIVLAEQAYFPTLYGWGAITITDPEQRGTYVIGEPEVLHPHLVRRRRLIAKKADSAEKPRPSRHLVKNLIGRLRNRRKPEEPHAAAPVATGTGSQLTKTETAKIEHLSSPRMPGDTPAGTDQEPPLPQGKISGFLKKSVARIARFVEQIQDIPEPVLSGDNTLLTLMLAYSSIPTSLYTSQGLPVIPSQLTPVCYLHFRQTPSTAFAEVINRFTQAGVQIKIFTESLSPQMLEDAVQAGLIPKEQPGNFVLKGKALAQISLDDQGSEHVISDAILEARIFHALDSRQKKLVVETLRREKQYVGMVGTSISDWDVLRLANLSIARKNSDQAIITNADISLSRETPPPYNPVLERGQQIVHSTLDVIKLNMLPIFYVFVLLAAMFLLERSHFIYNATQGGMVSFFTVVIPSVAVSFWAARGAVQTERLSRELAFFIIPPVLAISLAAITLFDYFVMSTGSVTYAQQATTHLLVSIGLVLFVFLKPPFQWLAGGARLVRIQSKKKLSDSNNLAGQSANITQTENHLKNSSAPDFRFVYTASVLLATFHLLTLIPLAQRFLQLKPLASITDYVIVWLCTLVCGVLIQVIWRLVRVIGKLKPGQAGKNEINRKR